MSAINLRREKEIAILEIDQPDSKVNVLNTQTMQELNDKLSAVFSDAGIKALLITSKKDGIFIAGADIKEIESISLPQEAIQKAEAGKNVLNRISDARLVTIAVINGACLGGGLELALACGYRVATFSDKVRLGLPEVRLGIIPGFGGTKRLPQVIGLIRALGMMLSGNMVSGRDALKYGLVDRLFPDSRIIEESVSFARELLARKERMRKKKKKKIIEIFLEDTPFGRAILFNQSKKNVLEKTKGFYPAPLKAIDVIRRTYKMDIKRASLVESAAFGELAITEVSKNLIKVFYLSEEFKKMQCLDANIKPAAIGKCGIVGAGVMGGGIAQLLAFYDIPSRVKDINYEAIKTALKTAKGLFDYALKKKKLRESQVKHKFALISGTVTYKGFENTDMVIEAVVEDINVKQKVFKELSEVVSAETVLASNTSSLPIINIAQTAVAPERVVGLHFFNPVHRMPLVEVIRSSKTNDKTIAATIAFARKIGKVVIVVNDVPGFLINRILLSYMNEAGYLLEEGAAIEHVDKVMRTFGMPVGPVELMDEVGIDVGYKVVKVLEEAYGERMHISPILEDVKKAGLFGKKIKKGFYIHGKKGKTPNPDIYKFIRAKGGRNISNESMLKRMVYVMVNEAARCLEEKVVDRPQTIDIGMIMGTGFPPFRAGLLRYADSVGLENIARELENFKRELNAARFKPCGYLMSLAEKKRGFYGTI